MKITETLTAAAILAVFAVGGLSCAGVRQPTRPAALASQPKPDADAARHCTAKLTPGGMLNGIAIDATHYRLHVLPGERIQGELVVETFNAMHANAVAPLGGTVDWGNRTVEPWMVENWIATGAHVYRVPVDKRAPLKPGTYHIIIAFRGEFNMAQVMSLTNWSASADRRAVWFDGNDIGFDWKLKEYQEAIASGTVRTNMLEQNGPSQVWQPAAIVVVQVE